MLAIVNDAAVAYRGVIPADRWHEPYMPEAELRQEIAAGVEFWGLETDDGLIGIMGVQPVRDVELIRHAYVRPDSSTARRRRGVDRAPAPAQHTAHARRHVGRCDAGRSAFYQRHGFELVAPARAAALLRSYWTIPERQIDTSVVLANPPLTSRNEPAVTRR